MRLSGELGSCRFHGQFWDFANWSLMDSHTMSTKLGTWCSPETVNSRRVKLWKQVPCKLSVCASSMFPQKKRAKTSQKLQSIDESNPLGWLRLIILILSTLLLTLAPFPIPPSFQQVVIQGPPVDVNLQQIFWVTKNLHDANCKWSWIWMHLLQHSFELSRSTLTPPGLT